jgi:chromo domain-containing protein 1
MAIETLDSDLLVSFASNDPPLQLRATLVTYNLAKLNEIAGPRPHLKVSQMIVAADFEKYVHNEAAGRFNASAVGGMTIGNHIASQELSSMCKLNTCGFIATVDHASKMLIYPSDAEGWKFLEEPGVKFDTPLTFRLLQALESADVSPLAVEDNLRSPIISICQDLAKVDTERLFKKKDGQVDVKTVFLMFPPTRQTELEIYVDFFAALGTRVYTSAMPGAWAYFRKIPRGNLLVIHADVPIWRIPGLFSFLTTTTSKVFRVGQSNGGFERLCPYGTAVLIPDDLFVYHPDDALDIIQEYLVRHKRKNDGAEFDRIVARPGVKPWLEKLALQHWQEHGRKDSRWIKLYHAMCQLCPPDAEDPDDLPNPLPTSWLISSSPELLPSYEALWEKDEDQAMEHLVNWYAGWSIEYVNSFRKLYIARPNHSGGSSEHESLDPKGWGNRYQHVGAKHAKDCFPK